MNKNGAFHKISKPFHLPALIPSIFVALLHFRLSIMVGPRANEIFQRWFDTGELATGSDAVIRSINGFLTKPIPTLFFANHPADSMPFEWWLATTLNSIFWGAVIYFLYIFSFKFLKKQRR